MIYHNTIISRFSKPIDCVLCISHTQRLDLPHLLLRISSGISVEMNWACFECSSPAQLFHLWGWLVPISRHIPNLKHIKIIWNKPLQLKILLKSARFAYNDGTPPLGKAGGGDRWPSNRSQFGNWTCKINFDDVIMGELLPGGAELIVELIYGLDRFLIVTEVLYSYSNW